MIHRRLASSLAPPCPAMARLRGLRYLQGVVSMLPAYLALPLAFALGACGDGSSGTGGGGGGGDAGPQQVTIQFAARVGDAPLDCNTRHPEIGREPGDFGLRDFRFYVHDVRLVRSDTTEVLLELEQDGRWQHQRIALLDFEDGTGTCVKGTPDRRDVVVGTAPPGDYVGLRFRLGVPFELNHTDVLGAPPPLDVSTLFWGWGDGRMFILASTTMPVEPSGEDVFAFAITSMGCEGDPRYGEVVSCSQPNRPDVDLPGFDPTSQLVVADLGALFAGNDLTVDSSCMATADQPSCEPLFASLGVDYRTGQLTPATQTLFRAAPR
jgi:uncharacterized repeat protein (TIGR04052 family)